MREHNAVAPNFVSPFDDAEQFERRRVVSADNKPTNAGSTALAFGVVCIVALGIGGGIGRLAGWPLAATILFSALIAAAFVLVVLIINNGDFPAWREIAAERATRKQAIKEHARLLQIQEHNRHVEEMKRLDVVGQGNVDLQLQLDALRTELGDMNRKLLTDGSGDVVVNNLSTYVTARPDPIRQMALAWVSENLYKDGRPNYDNLTSEGVLTCPAPWSARGEWPRTESEQGKRFLMDTGVIRESAGNRFKLDIDRYPTLASIGRI